MTENSEVTAQGDFLTKAYACIFPWESTSVLHSEPMYSSLRESFNRLSSQDLEAQTEVLGFPWDRLTVKSKEWQLTEQKESKKLQKYRHINFSSSLIWGPRVQGQLAHCTH